MHLVRTGSLGVIPSFFQTDPLQGSGSSCVDSAVVVLVLPMSLRTSPRTSQFLEIHTPWINRDNAVLLGCSGPAYPP